MKIKTKFKVLLAWDIEDPSFPALAVVRRLAESGAKAQAVYVESPAFQVMPARDRRTLREAWRAKLRERGVPLKFADGTVVPRLLAWIDRTKPNLVVLGAKRASWLERALFGSVAKAVRRRSSAPVLIVPSRRRKKAAA